MKNNNMKGIVRFFRMGDIESLFYFYLCFVGLSEIFILCFFRKLSHVTHSPFDLKTCFFALLIVPLLETMVLGFITEAFNIIFLKNDDSKSNKTFWFIDRKTKVPFIFSLLLVIFGLYSVINIDRIYLYFNQPEMPFSKFISIFLITLFVGIFILFVLQVFLSYKLKLKIMTLQLSFDQKNYLSKQSEQLISLDNDDS